MPRGCRGGAGTGGYCRARVRLPEGLLARLAPVTGRALHDGAPDRWRWRGRRVAVVDAAVGPSRGKRSGENALLRSIAGSVEPGRVLMAERYSAGWFDLALWRERRVGRGDHVVRWSKRQRPDRMDRDTYLRLRVELEVRVRVGQRGFRTRVVAVGTTATDPSVTGAELADLYRRRWQAELDMRSDKVTLGMDVLRCQSPWMVRKRIWAHRLGYNLVRTVMARAAVVGCREPRSLSVAAAVPG